MTVDPYARGWYLVALSSDVAPGASVPCRYFGRDLVLWRDGEGRPALTAARCPHLGTDLAVGGEVVDGQLRCRMHGWRFDASGRCVHSTGGRASGVDLDGWPLLERDGGLWLWWVPGTEPEWDAPRIPEHGDAEWTPLSNAGNRWVVRTSPQMIQENAVDIIHLAELHGFPSPTPIDQHPDGRVFVSNFVHQRDYTEAGVADPIEVRTDIEIFGLGVSKQNSDAGGMVFSTTICSTTPIDAASVDLRMTTSIKRTFDEPTTDSVLAVVVETTHQTIEEDLPLWESRDYAVRHFGGGDRGIAAFQRWATQFYDPAPS